jgi:ABC-type multidrug transport system ATPase subunit
MTSSQLLERFGFTGDKLTTRINDLSGGERRRLQLLRILLDEPNVLILDEPTNDLDTDMLAAIEDLLDSYAGTLLVVSHDRYLIERVTDQQYAVLDGNFRHLPGGVEQYLSLRAGQLAAASSAGSKAASATSSHTKLRGAELRNAEKELAAATRKLEKLGVRVDELHGLMATHDTSDYAGLGVLSKELAELEASIAALEARWLELGELLA